MAEEGKIEIAVEFPGTQQGTQGLTQVSQALGMVDTQADAAQASTSTVNENFAAMASGGTQLAQRIQGVAGATQGLVSALGSQNRTAGLVASLAGSVAQFAAMGSMLGPAGAVAGGIAGLVVGVAGLATAHRDARPEIEATTESIREEGEAASTAAERMRDFLDSISSESRTEAVASMAATITELTDEMYRLRDAGDGLGAEVMAERIRTLSRFAEADRANIAEEVGTTDAPRRGGGGAGGGLTEVDFNERYREERAAIMAARLEETARVNDEELTMELERLEAIEEAEREAAERRMDLQAEVNEALADAEADYQDRLAEGRQAQKDAETELLERQQTEREESMNELMGLMSESTALLGDTIKSIATGEKTAEEAFKGLAAAFLEMISEYTSLKAATEFADAAASFARYDYGGGAAHIGAGVAFTAVAVATGIGAAAINSAPQAPARPEANQQAAGDGRGGDLVINWNGPVVTAGTRAELGRELNTLAAEGAAL